MLVTYCHYNNNSHKLQALIQLRAHSQQYTIKFCH